MCNNHPSLRQRGHGSHRFASQPWNRQLSSGVSQLSFQEPSRAFQTLKWPPGTRGLLLALEVPEVAADEMNRGSSGLEAIYCGRGNGLFFTSSTLPSAPLFFRFLRVLFSSSSSSRQCDSCVPESVIKRVPEGLFQEWHLSVMVSYFLP